MPELPEVETTRRGLLAAMEGVRIDHAIVRERRMRQPISRALPQCVAGLTIHALTRRAKYLLIDCGAGTLLVHLGMSGRLWLVDNGTPPEKHDHFDLVLANGKTVRLRDPRRFGLVLWQTSDVMQHPLLVALGPEPLSVDFNGAALYSATRNRSAAIKLVIMDSHVVVGVGNIYASEALFRAGISPRIAARRLTRARCEILANKIRETLSEAITAGGSSIRDYVGSDGMTGNFQSNFAVYDRGGQPCTRCSAVVKRLQQGQRSTFYCAACQR
ncbi:MAG TPA: bifunctional DNA-formamidopyrimidine glycosylase/DNA-(apurinic or apyrimidinic site) lyase [Burkholderiales bacterium]|nr:bifunctional DNA-formamidopyrimidine glycosylase/DNA-(apurinic or apyrimidinic site) lyase [Burkholderiales bacterium]